MKTVPDRTKARMRIPYVDTAATHLPLREALLASIAERKDLLPLVYTLSYMEEVVSACGFR